MSLLQSATIMTKYDTTHRHFKDYAMMKPKVLKI